MLIPPIETLIFDLDGTLRHNVPSADDTQYNLALQLGVTDEPGRQHKGAYWTHYYWAQSPELLADIEAYGNGEGADFWANYSYRYLRSLAVPKKRAADLGFELFRRMEAEFHPENQVAPDVPETLATLKDAGYTLGLVSNRRNPCHEECEELGLRPYLDFAYVAGEVDVWKPDPRIFDRALEITGSAPERVIYVGDNYFADILGAKNAGLQPVLFDPTGIFPEADCPVINSIKALLTTL